MAFNTPGHVLITGASSGIGAALARHYARTIPQVRLTLGGRNAERLESVAAECRGMGAIVKAEMLDVTSREEMFRWFMRNDEQMPINLVIANAGISGGTGPDMESVDQTRMIFDVNLTGVLNTIEPAIKQMVARANGQIALVSSLAGYRGWPGAPAYCASKAAVKVYGEALRGALRDKGVKVNVICPGFIKSPMTEANDFPMPLMISAEKAAAIIASSLAKDRSRIAFPWPMVFLVWLVALLPDEFVQALSRKAPSKAKID